MTQFKFVGSSRIKIADPSNGLVFNDGELSLALATETSAGAISAEDHEKLEEINVVFEEITTAETDLAPGTYVLNNTAAITVALEKTKGEWFFISPYAQIETTSVTIEGSESTANFMNEEGVLENEPLEIDLRGIITNIASFDGVNFIVTVSAIVNTNPETPEVDASTALTPVSEVSADATAAVGQLIPVNTTSGPVTITAPSTPVAGNRFGVVDSRATSQTNNIIIDFGTSNFAGSSNDFVINTEAQFESFTYINATIGWIKN